MINEVSITALGVIENANIELGPGLNVLTGETGAGKTMVLTAVELLLGARADAGKIRAGHERATIDAFFTLPPAARAHLAAECDLEELTDGSDELVISRTLTPTRSRAHVNHRPVTAATLATLAPVLATIHGQADQLALRSPARQLQFLDEYGGDRVHQLKTQYQQAWAAAVAAKKQLDHFLKNRDTAQLQYDTLAPVIANIDQLQPEVGEEERLTEEAERIGNVEQLRHGLAAAYRELSGDVGAGTEALDAAARELQRVADTDRSLSELATRAGQIAVEAQTLAQDIRSEIDSLQADPARLEWINQRLQSLRALLRGRALDVAGLLQWAEEKRAELEDLEAGDERYDELKNQLAKAQGEVLNVGAQLTRARQTSASELASAVNRELAALAMASAKVRVNLSARPKPGPEGLDQVEITLQAHPDANPVALGAGASGGELSRVMLALEVSLANRAGQQTSGAQPATYIFDEVDAGIGGSTALAVGQRLAQLARKRQVIVVTHLPQVAAWADHHFVIDRDGATTTVRSVSGDTREAELARMLSGTPGSRTARAHAAELLTRTKMAESKA